MGISFEFGCCLPIDFSAQTARMDLKVLLGHYRFDRTDDTTLDISSATFLPSFSSFVDGPWNPILVHPTLSQIELLKHRIQ